MAGKIKSFLESFLQKVSASDILSDTINRYSKEQSYLLLQNIDNQLV